MFFWGLVGHFPPIRHLISFFHTNIWLPDRLIAVSWRKLRLFRPLHILNYTYLQNCKDEIKMIVATYISCIIHFACLWLVDLFLTPIQSGDSPGNPYSMLTSNSSQCQSLMFSLNQNIVFCFVLVFFNHCLFLATWFFSFSAFTVYCSFDLQPRSIKCSLPNYIMMPLQKKGDIYAYLFFSSFSVSSFLSLSVFFLCQCDYRNSSDLWRCLCVLQSGSYPLCVCV